MPNGTPSPPRNPENPVGGATMQQKTVSRLHGGLRRVEAWLVQRFKDIPTERVTISVNSGQYVFNETRYEYLISVPELRAIVDEIRLRLGDEVPPEYLVQQVVAAYEAGTGTAVAQLAALTDDYTRTITQVITSEPWQRRVALMRSRVFETMAGFDGDTATDLGRVLSQAVEDGLNPRDVVPQLRERFGVSRSRAERISRTEIGSALRRATQDETDDARERLGIRTSMLWFSALSSSTRANHAIRHGRIYSPQEVREFYSQPGEQVNCKCSAQPILLDESGNPIGQDLIQRMERQRASFAK